MYRYILILFVSLSLIVFSGCDEQAPVESLDSNNAQTLSKAPESSGVVIRVEGFEDYIAFREGDLVLLIGRRGSWGCDDVVQEFDLQYITSPSNEDGARIIAKLFAKDAFVQIFSSPPAPICEIIATTPIAEGSVKASYNDNDVYAWTYDNKNANSYKFSVNGKVDGSDGKSYNLNASLRGVWDGNDDSTLKENVKIQLTAKGKK